MSTPLITHRPRSGLSRPIIDFRNTDLPVPRRTEHHADLAGGQRQRDIPPDGLPTEGLRQPFDDHLDAHQTSRSTSL